MRSECQYCGKPLPQNAMRCPHCLSLLVEVETRPRWPLYLGFGFLAMILLVGGVVLFQYTESSVDDNSAPPKPVDANLQRELQDAQRAKEKRDKNLERIRLGNERAAINKESVDMDGEIVRIRDNLEKQIKILDEKTQADKLKVVNDLVSESWILGVHLENLRKLLAQEKIEEAKGSMTDIRIRFQAFKTKSEENL